MKIILLIFSLFLLCNTNSIRENYFKSVCPFLTNYSKIDIDKNYRYLIYQWTDDKFIELEMGTDSHKSSKINLDIFFNFNNIIQSWAIIDTVNKLHILENDLKLCSLKTNKIKLWILWNLDGDIKIWLSNYENSYLGTNNGLSLLIQNIFSLMPKKEKIIIPEKIDNWKIFKQSIYITNLFKYKCDINFNCQNKIERTGNDIVICQNNICNKYFYTKDNFDFIDFLPSLSSLKKNNILNNTNYIDYHYNNVYHNLLKMFYQILA